MICQGHEENSWINFLSKEKGNVFVSSKSQTLIKVESSSAVSFQFSQFFIIIDKEEGNKEGGLKWIVIEVQDQDRVLMQASSSCQNFNRGSRDF